jgi:hypothetical protein
MLGSLLCQARILRENGMPSEKKKETKSNEKTGGDRACLLEI